MGKITVVGSYIEIVTLDVERIPLEGETLTGWNYHTTPGGKGSNMAACAARLGADVTFLGKVGRDANGESFLKLLAAEKVRSDSVLFSEKAPTGAGVVIVSRTGSNSIVIDPGANAEFSAADVEAHAKVVQAAEVSLSPLEIPLATALAAARLAKAAGRKYILNPGPAVDLRGEDLSSVFALTPNESEGRVCLGLPPNDPRPDSEVATLLLKLGPEHVLLTLGEKGVLWASAAGVRRVPALAVKVVDTVGAGDAFNAGLAVGLSENKPVLEAIAMGVTAASLSTQRRETIASYSRRGEVDEHWPRVLAAAHATTN